MSHLWFRNRGATLAGFISGADPFPDVRLGYTGDSIFDVIGIPQIGIRIPRPSTAVIEPAPIPLPSPPLVPQVEPERVFVPLEEPEPEPVSLLGDIGRAVGIGGGFLGGDVNTGGGTILEGVLGGIEEIFRRQTTTAEERVLSGDYYPGDIERAIGNIEGAVTSAERAIAPYVAQLPGVQPVADVVSLLTGQSVSVAPCPTSGGSGWPAGACITVNDWNALGQPKGFEVAGVSAGGTLILRKKRRRRRRTGLTKGMMGDIEFLKGVGNSSAVRSYLTRVLR